MFNRLGHHGARLREALESRVRKLSKNPGTRGEAKGPARKSALRPWLFVAAGLALGFFAYRTALTEGRVAWLLAHAPAPAIWDRALQDRGFHRVSDSRVLFDLQRHYPQMSRSTPQIWVLESRRALLLASDDELILYSQGSPSPPTFLATDWEPLGYGWDAYEDFLRLELPVFHSRSAPATRTTRRVEPMDPRELRY